VALVTVKVVALAASVAVFWLVSPLLGAIMMIGAVGGLGCAVVPLAIERIVRWLTSDNAEHRVEGLWRHWCGRQPAKRPRSRIRRYARRSFARTRAGQSAPS
jgi:hypothetical protein